MELTITVLYLGFPAHYIISRDGQGIYHARLLRYDGPDGIIPPEDLTFMRGLRQWIGSYDEPWFVADLGCALEEALHGAAPGKSHAPGEGKG